MQANHSYILLFCFLCLFKLGFSQDIKTNIKTSIPAIKKDTVSQKKIDSLVGISKDSLALKQRDTIKKDSVKPKSVIEGVITHIAKDYTYQNAKDRTVTLYNEANITYTNIDLKAGEIIIDYKRNEVFARGIIDSTGYVQKPVFKQGNTESEQDSIVYNFKTKQAIIYGIKTKQGDMFTLGEKTKRVNDSVIYIRNIKFTTSDKENPDYYIATSKAKLIPNKKIIVGPSQLFLADVPTPLAIPFAYFPLTEESVSGFVMPQFDTGSSDRGIGFQNGGYYFAISDYVDLSITGDAWSNGSWGVRANSNYNKRYRFNGSFNLSFENNITGIRGFDNFDRNNNFNIRWSHSQDPKASPNSNLSASVNIGSSRFFRESLNQNNFNQNQNNTFQSSVNYSKNFVGTPFNMAVTLNHQQNTNTQEISMTLPNLTLNMERIFPFAKGGVQRTPLQKMGFNYNMQGQYQINTTDDEFFTSRMFETARSGVQHRTSTSTNISVLKYLTLSPNVNYEETWQFDFINKRYDSENDLVVTDTLRGFQAYREYNMSVNLSTNIYGTFNINKGRLKAIRHTIRPTISYSYRPDFLESRLRTVQRSADPLDVEDYTIFDAGLYGRPSSGISNSIGIAVNNVLEAKVAPKDPDSDEEDKKVMLLNNFNFNTSYNFAADSLNWSPVAFNAGTRLLNDKLAINVNASLDPYKVINDNGRAVRVNEFNPGFLRLTNANLTANYSLSSEDFKKDKDGNNQQKQSGNGANRPPDTMGANIDQSGRSNQGQLGEQGNKEVEAELYRAKIPWTLNLAYSATFINNGIDPGEINVHTVGFSGNIEFTPKWKVGYSSGYDFKAGAFSFSRFNINRDLDSWQFSFNWVPLGPQSSYTFFIGVKSSTLADLKWDKNRPPDRRLF